MEYFRMEVDKRFSNPIKLGVDDILLEAEDPFVLDTKIEKDGIVPDFFIINKNCSKYFCVSDSLKALIEIYSDGIERAVPFFPVDKDNSRQEFYWNIRLKEENYLVKRDIYSNEEPQLGIEPPYGKHCFLCKDINREYFIVSLTFAENLLRKYYKGIMLMPISIKEESPNE